MLACLIHDRKYYEALPLSLNRSQALAVKAIQQRVVAIACIGTDASGHGVVEDVVGTVAGLSWQTRRTHDTPWLLLRY